jgi:hypothetical protein
MMNAREQAQVPLTPPGPRPSSNEQQVRKGLPVS